MGSSEVQVFDGDGTIPPELEKLMEENKQLKEEKRSLQRRIDELHEERRTDGLYIERLTKDITFLEKKLRKIGVIVATEQPPEKYDDHGMLIDSESYEEEEARIKKMIPVSDPNDWKQAHRKEYDL